MQQWAYCGLRLTGTSIYLIKYLYTGSAPQLVQPDFLLDDSPSTTFRRWIALLGQYGWELNGSFSDAAGQELIFKHPMSQEPQASLPMPRRPPHP